MPISDPQECFVYVQLPNTLDVVTCGRFAQRGSTGSFVYGKSYLADPRAVELDKFELPLRPGTFRTARSGGIFGALRDASPDSWGRRIIERELGRSDLSELDFLLHSPDDRAGAISFGTSVAPPAPAQRFNQVIHLDALLAEAARIEEGLPPSSQRILELVQPGSSLGGARPKNVVEDAQGLWIAKFPSRSDRWNQVIAEAAMLELARQCGLEVPESRLVRAGRHDVLLVRRFDREKHDGGYVRHRMVSALTVLRAEESDRSRWSYVLLADELKRWVLDPSADLRELFARMVFNALISNIDDHPRNHALVARGKSWALSPAYDLTPFPQPSTERDLAMEVGTSRRANRENLLSECERFRLSRRTASARIDAMKKVVSAKWRRTLRSCGAADRDLHQLERAFEYEGFEYRP